MLQSSDKELIQKAKKGDQNAYKELFDKHSGKILSYLYRYIGDYQKAEDVTIETFLDVYKRLPAYREEGKFLSWVYRIAINYAKKEFRRNKKIKHISLDKPITDDKGGTLGDLLGDERLRPDSEIIGKEFSELVEKIIAELDGKYKDVLLLCDVQGVSYEEAARVLKCSKINVGTRLNRARTMLYDTLRQHGYDL